MLPVENLWFEAEVSDFVKKAWLKGTSPLFLFGGADRGGGGGGAFENCGEGATGRKDDPTRYLSVTSGPEEFPFG